jgi:hypothetical protein
MKLCTNCGSPAQPVRRGLCTPCYRYQRKYGQQRSTTLRQRLLDRKNAQVPFERHGPGRYNWDRTTPTDYHA